MRWPWQSEPEARSDDLTRAVISLLQTRATGTLLEPDGLAALEIASGLYSRAFAACKVVTPRPIVTDALTPRLLSDIARRLIRSGNGVYLLRVSRSGLNLLGIGSWSLSGAGDDPAGWVYEAATTGPSGTTTRRNVSSSGVVHCRWAVDPARPWLGLSPLGFAETSGRLAANLETRLADETGARVGRLLPIPVDPGDGGDDDPLASLKSQLGQLQGQTALVETTSGGWAIGRDAAPSRGRSDWVSTRIGADPPETLATLRSDSGQAVLMACGIPSGLVSPDAAGTAMREGWRQFYANSLLPMARLIEAELSAKLETPVSITFPSFAGSDLAGKTVALSRLVEAGLALDRSMEIVGLA